MASGRKPVKRRVSTAMSRDLPETGVAIVRATAHRTVNTVFTAAILRRVDEPTTVPPRPRRGDPRLVRASGPAARLPADDATRTRVLVSEAMAQQTQAARAAEHWERFMARFPTVEALAAATPADVLRAWQGLGYDRRALALWRAARVDRRRAWRSGARLDRGARGAARRRAVHGPGRRGARLRPAGRGGRRQRPARPRPDRRRRGGPRRRRDVQALADAAVPPDEPGDWTHALMDLGATVCRPRAPRCDDCPARPGAGTRRPRRAVDRSATDAARRPARRRRPFATTNRWLRGRILDRLRAAPGRRRGSRSTTPIGDARPRPRARRRDGAGRATGSSSSTRRRSPRRRCAPPGRSA